MGKRGRIIFATLVIAVLALLTWALLRPHQKEPQYDGKPLSYWLAQSDPGTTRDIRGQVKAMEAVQQIGTNAIPVLLPLLRVNDSPFKTKVLTWLSHHSFGKIHYTYPSIVNHRAALGFQALGPLGAGAVPELANILDQRISHESEYQTTLSLTYIGPQAKGAVPSLVALLNEMKVHPIVKPAPIPMNMRLVVEHALQRIDPETYYKVVTNASSSVR
jgi:hypothetical protein